MQPVSCCCLKSCFMQHYFRAVMLLTADEPTEALMTFLSKRAGVLARGIFEVQYMFHLLHSVSSHLSCVYRNFTDQSVLCWTTSTSRKPYPRIFSLISQPIHVLLISLLELTSFHCHEELVRRRHQMFRFCLDLHFHNV